jgi:hypothetical protein
MLECSNLSPIGLSPEEADGLMAMEKERTPVE